MKYKIRFRVSSMHEKFAFIRVEVWSKFLFFDNDLIYYKWEKVSFADLDKFKETEMEKIKDAIENYELLKFQKGFSFV